MPKLTQREAELAMERIRKWPREARVALTKLTEDEAQTIALLVALLDIRPHEGTQHDADGRDEPSDPP